jgi:ABC-type sugar transport system permease subunit
MRKYLFLTILTLVITAFAYKPAIKSCYLSFSKVSNLTVAAPDHFPDENDHTRTLPTSNGEVSITILDGYRVLYNNKKKAPFVNLKVELSDASRYEVDKQHVLDNLNYINANSTGMETKDLITLTYNGYKIYGLSRAGIERGNTLGTFVMFPGDNTIVYFYFNNINPEYRNFSSLEDYQSQRNQFIEEYTAYLKGCKR